MQKILVTMIALLLTTGAQGQQTEGGEYQSPGLDAMMAAMTAAKIHQDSIDVSSLMAVYDYECRTQDEEGQAVTDRMKLCLLVGQHCTRSFPYRKFLKEREWASGQNSDMRSRDGGGGKPEFQEGYDFCSPEEIPLLRSESYCYMPEVWTNYPDGKMTVRDAIPPTVYETREEGRAIDWTLSDDTLTVGGYLCKTATCLLHGRKWTVRYAEAVPTSAGPWKLCGLPGLILCAEADGTHRFTIADIQRTAAPIYYETSAITSKTTEEKLIANRIKTFGNRLYLRNPWSFIDDNSNADRVYDTEGMLVNGVYVHDKPHVFHPLESE